jgi:malonate-semialdehyde dehydrogenase (acetylating) / methylmalonate-semialdehyde dehydrogenase
VINMVNGDKEAVDTLLVDPRVRGISFVGSTPVARYIYETAAKHGKRVQCQGGAKNFLTVMPDANLDAAIPNLIASFYGNTGQRCLAGANLVVVGDNDELIERFVAGAKALKVGNGLDPTVQMGPLAAEKHFERVLGMIQDAVDQGGELLLDGRGVEVPGYPDGYWLGPCVFDGIGQQHDICYEEVFGPVASIVRVADLDEAIELANSSKYGNASSIYTNSGKAARDYKTRVQGGNVGINIGVAAPMAYFPFGGMAGSFFGDLHGQAKDGINFFTDRKVVITRWP